MPAFYALDFFADEPFGDVDDDVADGLVTHALDDAAGYLLDHVFAQRLFVEGWRRRYLALFRGEQRGKRFSQRGN